MSTELPSFLAATGPASRTGEPAIISLGAKPLGCCGKVAPLLQDMRDSRRGWYKCFCGQRYFVDHRKHTVRAL